MSSSDGDDQQDEDTTSVFDQLKSIKPFTIDQLYLLHPDVGKPPTASLSETINDIDLVELPSHTTNQHQRNQHHQHHQLVQTGEIYVTLIEYEKLKRKLAELRVDIKKLHKKIFDHVDKSWTFKEESTRKIAMCQAGKIAETTFKYNQAVFNPKQLDSFALKFSRLNETITKDYIYYSFESQIKRNKVATQFSIAYQTQDVEIREAKLKSSICTLTDFLGHLCDSKSDLVVQCRKWLRALASKFLENGRTENYRFIVSQIARGPAGTADWMVDLIECKPYDQVSGFDSAPQYITHCSALLSELFYTLKLRLNQQSTNSDTTHDNQDDRAKISEQNWSLIDPRFTCSEDLNVNANSSNLLSESDVIKLCLRISIPQIFKSYVRKCLKSDDEFHLETDKNYEYLMLKLLTIGTIIIKTYQIGLETFNSIQYGNLIEYLSSQIRCTVIILSDQWTEFKTRLRGLDDALFMRLQVEYDNFILRSILIILELRESGIWRNLSLIEQGTNQDDVTQPSWTTDSIRPAFAKLLQVTGLSSQVSPEPNAATSTPSTSQPANLSPISQRKKSKPQLAYSSSLTYEFSIEWFKEVSEPMLWHILWQFYNNAFVSSCDYHSDNYWVERFQDNSVEYLFINKIIDSPPGECSYLLNSITSMLLSRIRSDSKLIDFIATEIFNLSYKHPKLKEKITIKGTRSLMRCAERFPRLISVYISLIDAENLDDHVVELVKCCSLNGWLCNSDEMDLLASWLVEFPLESSQNKVARLVISKLLLNSSENINIAQPVDDDTFNTTNMSTLSKSNKLTTRKYNSSSVDLKLRRRIALLLYEASQHHLPEPNDFGPQSLGASVEVAFGSLYCERNAIAQNNLLDLAIDTNYQQFYIWAWRILFALPLHILSQPETDWNDVQSRSGSSRSVKNTVLVADSFHPVPTIQDSECMSLSDGLKKQVPMASYIYLLLTDATWQFESLESCLVNLNVLADSGHLTPSLMAVKYLTICHLNDLSENPIGHKQIIDYFATLLTSSFDATRIASLISTQMSNLKQFRQLQLSQFYIKVFLEVSNHIAKQISSSWLTSNSSEISLDKIACLLDYIVKFNFPTQRLEIIQKFYDSSYLMQGADCTSKAGWFGSLFATNSLSTSSSRREFLTNLHVLTKNFKKYTWLRWVTTECDALRLEKIWEDVVVYLSSNEEANLDVAIKKVCPQVDANVLKSTLPIYSWIKQIFGIMESDINHPLCPLIWYNFFLNYFANSLNGVSVGYKLVSQETINKLMTRLDSLCSYHLYKHRNWASSASGMQQNSLARLYRSYKFWLHDPSLREAYVDIDRLKEDYSVPLLKDIMGSSTEGACLQYIDIQTIETQNRNLRQVWTTATNLTSNQFGKEIMCIDSRTDKTLEILTATATTTNDHHEAASDAVSLIVKSYKDSTNADTINHKSQLDATSGTDELSKPLREELHCLAQGQDNIPKEKSFDELIELIKRNFNQVFDESTLFGYDLIELDKTKLEIDELVKQLYTNKKREFVKVVPCIEGDDCPGPAKIRLEAEEASIDERKNQCIQDRRRQCQELLGELLLMPRNLTVQSTIIIEEFTRRLVNDSNQSKAAIETLLNWISEPATYKQLNGSFYPANHLLKTILEILSNTPQVDTYNTSLINVCLQHPSSVQIFSPHLSPAVCSDECFLELYKTISSKQTQLGTMTMFVLLSKFDINSWLNNLKSTDMHHELIKATCYALKDMGKQPDESCELTFDLFRRHLQIELSPPNRRKFNEISLVASKFLEIMSDQKLAPNLWTDFMSILGLERDMTSTIRNRSRAPTSNKNFSTRSNSKRDSYSLNADDTLSDVLPNNELDEVTFGSTVEDVIRLADMQTILDYQSLNELMSTFSKFLNEKHETLDVTLLEYYHDYLDQFIVVLLGLTLMWLKIVGEQYPDNHELIWAQFIDLWYNWIFLNRNCQNVGKTSYSLIANYFVAALRFMIHKIPDNTQAILQSILAKLNDYTKQTKEVVYLELTILQRCMKNLPWSNLVASVDDFEHLAQLSEQENYNISNLVSHIIQHIDTKNSLDRIHNSHPNILPRVVERFVETIILQSTHLKGYRLHGRYLPTIPTERIPHLAALILPRMEFVSLEHSQNNKLLVNLLRFMCIKMDYNGGGGGADGGSSISTASSRNNHHQSPTSDHYDTILDSFNRTMIYAQFVSNYLVDLIRRHPVAIKQNGPYLFAVMDNSLQELKLLNSPGLDLSQKTSLYESLLECCSCESISNEARLFLAESMTKSSLLKDKPIVILEILHAVGQILRDAKVLVYVIETLIYQYLKMGGHYEKIWRIFRLRVLPSDIYLNVCIEDRASLALLVYFESLAHGTPMLDSAIVEDDNNFGPSATTNSCDSGGAGGDTKSQTSVHSTSQSNSIRIWSSYLHWLAQLTLATASNISTDNNLKNAKLATAWLRMLDLLEPNLNYFLNTGTDHTSSTRLSASASSSDNIKTRINYSATENHPSITEGEQQKSDAPPTKGNDDDSASRVTAQEKQQQQANNTKLGEKQSVKTSGRQNSTATNNLLASHKCLIDLIKQLIHLYDVVNSGGLWSYLRSNSIRDERTSRISIISLAVAYFLIDRTLTNLTGGSSNGAGLPGHLIALRDEVTKLMKNCLGKLESARRAKSYIEYAQFIETLIESVQRNDKVQYREGLELIATFVKIVLKPPGAAVSSPSLPSPSSSAAAAAAASSSAAAAASPNNSSWTPMELADISDQQQIK